MRTLETPRLILRPLLPEDEAIYCSLHGETEVMRHIAAPLAQDAAARVFQSALRRNAATDDRDRCWGIVRRGPGDLIGVIGWHVQSAPDSLKTGNVGAILGRDAQGDGISVEAGTALMNHAFAVCRFAVLITQHQPTHIHAARMMAKLQFERDPQDHDTSSQVTWRMSIQRWTSLYRCPANTVAADNR